MLGPEPKIPGPEPTIEDNSMIPTKIYSKEVRRYSRGEAHTTEEDTKRGTLKFLTHVPTRNMQIY